MKLCRRLFNEASVVAMLLQSGPVGAAMVVSGPLAAPAIVPSNMSVMPVLPGLKSPGLSLTAPAIGQAAPQAAALKAAPAPAPNVALPSAQAARTEGAAAPSHSFRVGEQVVTWDNNYGQVTGIFGNGDLAVYFNEHGTLRYPPGNLARRTGAAYGFSNDEYVITSDLSAGRVVGFFENGYLAVYIPNLEATYHYPAADLAHRTGSAYGFSIDQDVVTPENYYGKVIGIFKGGYLAVYMDGVGTWRYPANALARRTGSAYGFSIGQSVITPENYYGWVTGIFQGGDLAVYMEGIGTWRYAARSLGRR